MYIWTGIYMEDQLPGLKQKRDDVARLFAAPRPEHALPLHVSLKISFPVPDGEAAAVIGAIGDCLRGTSPFSLPVRGVEREEGIVWVRMGECPPLAALQTRLNDLLAERFAVPRHPYDLDFKFHATLFMDEDREKTAKAFALLKDAPLPSSLVARRFVVGTSPTGKPGSYAIVFDAAL